MATSLDLPDYAFEVETDSEFGTPDIEDLGFKEGFILESGGLTGQVGDGSTTITVTVTGGTFALRGSK